jgi:hypothetical protein
VADRVDFDALVGAWRSTFVSAPSYGIRLDQVLRRDVHSAASVRAFCGVPPSAELVLLCFAEDAVLERFWDDELRLAAIASGDWDLIAAPSFSLWFKRPRPMHFHALNRSYDAFRALQLLGANAVPRAEFVDTADVDAQADWFNSNPAVSTVSLDWMTTCRQNRDWLEGVELLSAFDVATERRLHYLINGTTVDHRVTYVARQFGADRLTFTEATSASPARDIARNAEHLAEDLLPTPMLARRILARDLEVRAAAARGEAQRREPENDRDQSSGLTAQ